MKNNQINMQYSRLVNQLRENRKMIALTKENLGYETHKDIREPLDYHARFNSGLEGIQDKVREFSIKKCTAYVRPCVTVEGSEEFIYETLMSDYYVGFLQGVHLLDKRPNPLTNILRLRKEVLQS